MRGEPTAAGVNRLLALATGLALLLLTASATVFATPAPLWRYGAVAVAAVVAYLLVSALTRRWTRTQGPLVVAGSPLSLALASSFPLVIILMAFAPVFWPGADYGLSIIVGAVLFGLTVRSAWATRG